MVDALDESRDLLRDSLEEFKREQREYRGQVEAIMKNKQVLIQRQKGEDLWVLSEVETSFVLFEENLIPISIFRRQKQDVEGLADLRPNSSINPTYQAYFEALLTPNQTDQHPSDRAAVIKYIRRRERRRRADENRQTYELSDDILEKVETSAGSSGAILLFVSFCSANCCVDGENGRHGREIGTWTTTTNRSNTSEDEREESQRTECNRSEWNPRSSRWSWSCVRNDMSDEMFSLILLFR